MQRLAELCIRRPVFATMIVLSLVVIGATSYFQLSLDKHPQVELPTIAVRTVLPGAAPEEVETSVVQPIEEAVNTIEGVAEIRSGSGQSTSNVILTFNLNRDIETAAQDVRDRVAAVVRNLPIDALPPVVNKFDADQSPSLSIALISERPIRELTEIADKVVREQIERSPGVGEVKINGGLERAVNIWIDPDRLTAYQLPITAVRDAIVRQNADVPGGNVTSGNNEQNLRTMGRLVSTADFNDLVVATIKGAPVRIRDIGYAEDGTKEARSSSRLNGKRTVTLEVRRQSGSNTIDVIEGVKANLAKIAAQLPPDVQLQTLEDQSGFIYAALHEINIHLLMGSILASLVVMAFMRNWQATIIAAVSIPCSLISAFGVMWALHFTLNSVTMLALVLMVGIVIDDALVVLENTFRLHGREENGAFRSGASCDCRRRTRRTGHHVEPGRDLCPRLFHVEHRGTVPLSIRDNRSGGGDGKPAGFVHPDSDDVRPNAACFEHGPGRARRGSVPSGFLPLDRFRIHGHAQVFHEISSGRRPLRCCGYRAFCSDVPRHTSGLSAHQRR